jgi:hypothetical protein
VIQTKVIDGLLPQRYADDIESDLTHLHFDWHYVRDVTYQGYGNNGGFVNLAYDLGKEPSQWFPFVKPLVYMIEEASGYAMEKLLRVRIGLLTPEFRTDYEHNTPHVDFLMPHRTACYYVNDSDGDTILFDQELTEMGSQIDDATIKSFTENTEFTTSERCSPKKNRLCIFDGYRFHASTRPKDHDRRIVITVNYA